MSNKKQTKAGVPAMNWSDEDDNVIGAEDGNAIEIIPNSTQSEYVTESGVISNFHKIHDAENAIIASNVSKVLNYDSDNEQKNQQNLNQYLLKIQERQDELKHRLYSKTPNFDKAIFVTGNEQMKKCTDTVSKIMSDTNVAGKVTQIIIETAKQNEENILSHEDIVIANNAIKKQVDTLLNLLSQSNKLPSADSMKIFDAKMRKFVPQYMGAEIFEVFKEALRELETPLTAQYDVLIAKVTALKTITRIQLSNYEKKMIYLQNKYVADAKQFIHFMLSDVPSTVVTQLNKCLETKGKEIKDDCWAELESFCKE